MNVHPPNTWLFAIDPWPYEVYLDLSTQPKKVGIFVHIIPNDNHNHNYKLELATLESEQSPVRLLWCPCTFGVTPITRVYDEGGGAPPTSDSSQFRGFNASESQENNMIIPSYNQPSFKANITTFGLYKVVFCFEGLCTQTRPSTYHHMWLYSPLGEYTNCCWLSHSCFAVKSPLYWAASTKT